MLLTDWLDSDQLSQILLLPVVRRSLRTQRVWSGVTESLEVRLVPARPLITIEKVSTVTEGNSGTADAQFRVFLSSESDQAVTVKFATSDGTAKVADSDYVANSGTLTFDPGETEQNITVKVNGDTRDEADETFFVKLSGATNARLGINKGTGTISNDDSPLSLSINSPAAINEGDTGNATVLFTVSLSRASTQDVTVQFATSDGTATTANNDYQANDGTLTFKAGETTKEVAVKLVGDTQKEADETFKVILSNAVGAAIKTGGETGTATITNDDTGLPAINIDSTLSVVEGNSGTTDATLHVKLSQASAETVKVKVSTGDGTATTDDNDYTAASSTITFAPGETDKTFVVKLNGDTKLEPNETIKVTLTAPDKGTLGTSVGTITITNDDTGTVSIAKTTDAAETTPPTNGRFTVTQTGATGTTTVVTYTVSGTATSGTGNDFQPLSGFVTIPAGQTTASIDVTPLNDTLDEVPPETVTVTLTGFTSHDSNVSLDPTAANLTATINILDASTLPALGGVSAAVTYKANDPAINIVPTMTARGDTLAGGTLTINSNAVGSGSTATDEFQFPSTSGLGTSTGPKFENGQITLTVQLNQNVTAAAIQTFLRDIKFSTKGSGLDTATRSVKFTLSDAAKHTSTLTQTINVQK